MHLVQLLLPLADAHGQPIDAAHFRQLRDELTERFGGLTAYSRAPADGLWKEERAADAPVAHDAIVVYEVMVDGIDVDWWRDFRTELEQRFGQEELVIRAQAMRRL